MGCFETGNPRLLYYWSKDGGGLEAYFEDDPTKLHYNRNVLKGGSPLVFDNVGPFGK
jgi:hypothetical protein